MALDAICLTAVVEELRRTLEGGKIDKIYQPSRDEVVMAIRGAGENVKLLLSASPNGPRMHLTKEVRENPAQPPMFCMLLRKHLTGGRILALEQPELERIVLLRLEVVDELGDRVPRTLVLEAMGRRANLILLDAEGRILDCIRRVEGDVTTGQRGVMPGLFYHLPEPHPGLSPLLERELDFRSDGESRNESLQEKAERLREAVGAEGYVPYLLLRDGKGVDFSFLPILQYGPGTQLRRYETFSRLLDDFYAARGTAERVGQRGQELLKAVKRVRERVERRVGQQEIEREATRDRERKRELGDILTSNFYALRKGMKSARLTDYYDPEGRETEIPLDPLLTPQQNAAKYYKRYTKAKTAEKYLREQMALARRDLAYLESILQEIQQAETEQDFLDIRGEMSDAGFIRKQGKKVLQRPSKPREFKTSGGFRVLVGRNNRQNDKLTLKDADYRDLWFHVQKLHGSHVILCTNGGEPGDQDITEAASLAAYYSQAKDSANVPVDCTQVKYVKKPAGAHGDLHHLPHRQRHPGGGLGEASASRKITGKKSTVRCSFLLNGSGCVRRVAGVVLRVAEQQRDAPETCQPDQRVDDPGEDGGLPAEQECDGIKAEQPHAAPVQRADDHKDQRNFVNNHIVPPV